jgi:hypothetical protein
VEQGQGLLAIFSADDPIAGQLKAHHQHPTNRRLIVNNEQRGALIAARRQLRNTNPCGITLPVLRIEGHTRYSA